jgi:hypothetical protein
MGRRVAINLVDEQKHLESVVVQLEEPMAASAGVTYISSQQHILIRGISGFLGSIWRGGEPTAQEGRSERV